MVANGLASVNEPSKVPTVLGAVTGVEVPSMPVISVPFELVSGASTTFAVAVSVAVAPPESENVDREGVAPLLVVRVAAEHLEDRISRVCRTCERCRRRPAGPSVAPGRWPPWATRRPSH